MNIDEMKAKLDVDKDGKVTVEDAKALLDAELAGKSPKAAFGAGFICGAVAGAAGGFIIGRASK